jgi:hypothetical protein
LALTVLVAPLPSAAQTPSKTFRVGHLFGGGRTPDGLPPRPLRDALDEPGYVEGRNVTYEARFAEGQIDQLPGLAAERVRLKADVIVAQGGAAAEAAKQTTSTIPIIIAPASGDAVAIGLIASLPRPGGNVTGMTDEIVQLSGKRVEMCSSPRPLRSGTTYFVDQHRFACDRHSSQRQSYGRASETAFEIRIDRVMHTVWKDVLTPQMRAEQKKWRAPADGDVSAGRGGA